MRRRAFITLLGGAAAAAPLTARAQQAERMQRIGVLLPSQEDADQEYQARLGLADAGEWEASRMSRFKDCAVVARLISYASSFPIWRVTHAPRDDGRRTPCRRLAPHVAGLYRDTAARFQIPCRDHRSISTSFHWKRIAPHVSRPFTLTISAASPWP